MSQSYTDSSQRESLQYIHLLLSLFPIYGQTNKIGRATGRRFNLVHIKFAEIYFGQGCTFFEAVFYSNIGLKLKH